MIYSTQNRTLGSKNEIVNLYSSLLSILLASFQACALHMGSFTPPTSVYAWCVMDRPRCICIAALEWMNVHNHKSSDTSRRPLSWISLISRLRERAFCSALTGERQGGELPAVCTTGHVLQIRCVTVTCTRVAWRC